MATPFLKMTSVPFTVRGTGSEQEFAAECLATMKPLDKTFVPVLVGMLSHNYRAVRYYAIEALGKMGHDATEAVEPLRKLLNDPEPWVQFGAATALRKIRQKGP
jgi:HEAT repeat protein